MTNFLLVKATVTTSTMDALPIITPREVSAARNLLLRNASMATDTVSRRCMVRPSRDVAALPARFCLWDRRASWWHTPWRPRHDRFDFQTGAPANRAPGPGADSRCASAQYSNIPGVAIRPHLVFAFAGSRQPRDKISLSHRWAKPSGPHPQPPVSASVDCASWHNPQYQKSSPAIWR